MVDLERTVRFCLNAGSDLDRLDDLASPRAKNTFSAWPAMRGLGRYYELQVGCRGAVDPDTGYCLNIKQIDRAVRNHALPYLQDLVARSPSTDEIAMGALMQNLQQTLHARLERSVSYVRFILSRYYYLAIWSHDVDHIEIGQQYEFSAAHRLHAGGLSDQENRVLFGKCNNPSGHGHNYRLEVRVRAAIDDQGHVLPVEHLDQLVHESVIEKLDHKHLNSDVPQFKDLNPSVENIARVVYEMLEPRVSESGLQLESVSVWETEKTVCTYHGAPLVEEALAP